MCRYGCSLLLVADGNLPLCVLGYRRDSRSKLGFSSKGRSCRTEIKKLRLGGIIIKIRLTTCITMECPTARMARNMKKFVFFIGIDVSKLTLDIATMQNGELRFHRKIQNTMESITEFVEELKLLPGFKVSKAVFGLEQTGIYSNRLLHALGKMKAGIVVQDSGHIKSSLGSMRGKNDKMDAARIATYLYRNRENLMLWQGKRRIIGELASLSALRNRLASTLRALKVPLKEDRLFIDEKLSVQNNRLCEKSICSLSSDIAALDSRIKEVWKGDAKISHLMALITSIPCIGDMTAIQMIISSNEFQTITTPKQFASYAGVAPFPYQSGTSLQGRMRVSHMANKKVKTLLHTCAVLSIRFVPEMKEYYTRKTKGEGKHSMLVLNAIRSKLILRVYACVKADRTYIRKE
ncbi:MAG: IS110 family transposase [Flavobacterium sp.]|nr:MAG: IS110 family transposase [Flavobacterium sp.]